MSFRIRTQYVIALVALLGIVTVLVSVALLAATDRLSREFEARSLLRMEKALSTAVIDHAESTSRITAERLLEPLFFEDISSVGNILIPLRDRPEVLAVAAYTSDGMLFHNGSSRLETFGDPAPKEVLAVLQNALDRMESIGDTIRFITPISSDGHIFGVLDVLIDSGLVSAQITALRDELETVSAEAIDELILRLAVISAIALVLAVGVATLLAARLSRPIRDLAGATSRIEAGDFGIDLSSDRTDELGDLAHAFDRMAETLRDTMVSRSQLELTVADQTRELRQTHEALLALETERREVLDEIGDELRHPITELEKDVEHALRNQDSALELRHSMSRLLLQIRDIRRLVDDLRLATRSQQPRAIGRGRD